MNDEQEKFRIDVSKALEELLEGHYYSHIIDREKMDKVKEEKELPNSNSPPDILRENAWIVWICDEKGHIIDLQVYELDKNDPDRWNKTQEYVNRICKEKRIVYMDIGANCSYWENWGLNELVWKLSISYGFKDKKIAAKCLRRLSRIKEFKMQLIEWLIQYDMV